MNAAFLVVFPTIVIAFCGRAGAYWRGAEGDAVAAAQLQKVAAPSTRRTAASGGARRGGNAARSKLSEARTTCGGVLARRRRDFDDPRVQRATAADRFRSLTRDPTEFLKHVADSVGRASRGNGRLLPD
jgi:hypothetical protein